MQVFLIRLRKEIKMFSELNLISKGANIENFGYW